MHSRVISILLVGGLAVILIVGIGIGALNADWRTFWASFGTMLSGAVLSAALGVWAAISVVPVILDRWEENQHREIKRKLLRSIGHDCVGAISRVFSSLFAPKRGPMYDGDELNYVWYYRIETGRISAEGFKDAIYGQYLNVAYTEEEKRAKSEPPRRVILSSAFHDFDIALLMVTRALGRAYARFDLFDPDELPTNSLESAAAILKDAKAKGHLDNFEGATLILPLGEAAETCGKLL